MWNATCVAEGKGSRRCRGPIQRGGARGKLGAIERRLCANRDRVRIDELTAIDRLAPTASDAAARGRFVLTATGSR